MEILWPKRKGILDEKQVRLRCPLCRAKVGPAIDIQSSAARGELCRTQDAGDLTECHRCMAMLEYSGSPGSLSLHTTPWERARQFHELAQTGCAEPSLPALLACVKKFRRMPERSRNARRFGTAITLQVSPGQLRYSGKRQKYNGANRINLADMMQGKNASPRTIRPPPLV